MSTVTVDPAILAFFSDADSSSAVTLRGNHINAPNVVGTNLTLEEIMTGGGTRVVLNVLDRSPSMKEVTNLMIDDFTGMYIQALQEARSEDVAAIRVGGLSFSSDITPIWNDGSGAPLTFHELNKVPPLTLAEYNPSLGYGTALHQAIIDALAFAANYGAQISRDTGTQPEIDIAVLSDGKNNEAPQDTASVRRLIEGTKKGLVRFLLFFFETSGGLSESQFQSWTQELGFDPENVTRFGQLPGETPEERKTRFRRAVHVMSKTSASKGTSAIKAAADTL